MDLWNNLKIKLDGKLQHCLETINLILETGVNIYLWNNIDKKFINEKINSNVCNFKTPYYLLSIKQCLKSGHYIDLDTVIDDISLVLLYYHKNCSGKYMGQVLEISRYFIERVEQLRDENFYKLNINKNIIIINYDEF